MKALISWQYIDATIFTSQLDTMINAMALTCNERKGNKYFNLSSFMFHQAKSNEY